MTRPAWRLAAALLLTLAGLARAACPADADLSSRDLHGLWRAEIAGRHVGTLLLEANPNWAGSVAGTINRDGRKSQVAGDLDDGDFTLEESADGVRIAATWTGEPVAGTCGREIRGTWQAEGRAERHAFVLRRLGDR